MWCFQFSCQYVTSYQLWFAVTCLKWLFRVSSNARTKTIRRNLKTASSRTMSTYVVWNLVLIIEIHDRAMNMSSCVEKIDYQYVCVWSISGPRDHDLFGTRWKQRFWLHKGSHPERKVLVFLTLFGNGGGGGAPCFRSRGCGGQFHIWHWILLLFVQWWN